MGKSAKSRLLFALAFIAISACLPAGIAFAQDPTTQPTVVRLTPAEKDDLNRRATDLDARGLKSYQADDLSGALKEFQESLALRTKASEGQDDLDLATTMNDVAMCLDTLGRHTEALPLFQAAMEMKKRLANGRDEEDLAISLNNLAFCLDSLGRSSEALPIYQAALEMRTRIYKTEDNAELAISLNDVAYCLDVLGRSAEALPLFQAALEMRERLCKDQDNSDVATSLNNLAGCLDSLGRSTEALPMYKSALEMRRRLYKDQDNSDIAQSLNNVAYCLNSLGRSAEAMPIYQSALEMRKRLSKDQDNPETAQSMNNLADCLDALGRSAEALPIYRATLEMRRRIFNDQDHPDVAESLNNLAACLQLLGHSAEALTMFQSALEMETRIYKGQDHPDIASCLNNIAACLDALGRNSEALPMYQTALEMRRRIYKDQDHPDVAMSLSNAAYCLQMVNRNDEALPLYEAALAMKKRIYKDIDHPDIAISLNNLATCLDALGRSDESLPLYQAALEMRQRIYKDQDHPDVAESLNNLAASLDEAGRSGDAATMYQAALAMSERMNDPRLFRYSCDFGISLLRAGDPSSAAAAFKKSIDALEKARQSLGGDDQDRMGFMKTAAAWDPFNGMVRAELQLQQFDEAVEYFDQGKARSLLDILERAERQTGGDVLQPAEEAARQSRDTARLAEIGQARQDLAAADDEVRQLTAAMNQARSRNDAEGLATIQQLQPKLDDARNRYGDAHRRFFILAGQTVLATAASSLQIQSLPRDHQHLLMYSITDTDALVLVIPPSGQAITGTYLTEADGKTRVSGTDVKQAIQRYREGIVAQGIQANRGAKLAMTRPAVAKQEDLPAQGYALFSELLPPDVWKEIQGDDLIYVVPDASMSGMPLEMLVPEQPVEGHDPTYWLDKGPPVVYGPSAAALLDRSRVRDGQINSQRTFSHDIVLLGDPVLQQDQNAPRLPPPSTGAYVQSVQAGSAGEAIGLCQGAVITGYGPFTIAGKDDFESALDKLLVRKFHDPLSGTPKVKFWLQGHLLERELALDLDKGSGVEIVDLTPAMAEQLTGQQPTIVAALRDASLTRYGALIPLPGTRTEVEGIYKVFTGSAYVQQVDDHVVVLLGKDATAPRLIEAAPGSRYLHLATHGLVESGTQAIYSSVVLTQPQVVTPQDTGLLTLQDLFDHWWGKLGGTELVVLSACDSQGLDESRNNAIAGEGVYGLPWGFMYAGSPAVIASTWEVQDNSTAQLMEQFYSQLRDSPRSPKLKAFVAARQRLKKDYPQPFYWAPFIYLGDPR